MSFVAELRRRNVIRMAGLYIAGAWLIIEVAGTVLPMFDAPAWLARSLVILLAIGLVPALAFSWVFELTPDGFKRDAEVSPQQSIAPQTARRMDRMIIALLALALACFGFDRFVLAPRRDAALVAATTQSVTSAAAKASPGDKSIAVLPFENLSDDKSNAYFASGIQDLILTRLAAIGELKVISRTSTQKYASRPDDVRAIAAELGVATLLEGSVQKSGTQVLINVQLIDAANGTHLWAEAYPRTLENIFDVEGEVAQKIADALKAKLTPTESASVAAPPTRNAFAFDAFLKAEYLLRQASDTWRQETFLAADAGYEAAIALDPEFALAHAKLASCRIRRHWFATLLTADELATVRRSADRALALAPNLPEAHLALGYYHYWGFRHYDDAVQEFQRTLAVAPSSVEAIAGLAFIARRKGEWDQAVAGLERALRLSPRDGEMHGEQAANYVYMRRYVDAEREARLALELQPDNANSKDFLLMTRLFGFGDPLGARAAYQPPPGWRIATFNATAGDVFHLVNPRVYPDLMDRRFDEALAAWDAAPVDTPDERLTGRVARVAIQVLAGRRGVAQAECGKLEPELQGELVRSPLSLPLLQQLGWVELCLGRNAQAIESAERAYAQLPIEKDAYNGGPVLLAGLAQVQAQAGAADDALRNISRLMSLPTGGVMSRARLALDPVWDPLRKDPRFGAMLERASAEEPTSRR